MPGPEIELQVFLYGSDQKRLELKLAPRLPQHDMPIVPGGGEREEYVQALLRRIMFSIKHSGSWQCEFCGKPARETVIQFNSWLRLTPPRAVAYLHAICSSDPGPCRTTFDAIDLRMGLMSGHPLRAPQYVPREPGQVFPLLAACASCEEEKTADINTPGKTSLMRCSGCKVTRYCGKACQREDWRVHKEFCKILKSARWVQWDAEGREIFSTDA
ncbi:hypothetical protein PUNSTDRAFT_136202 [Punctularia strigosozonata HHB-11173 SS5]|uniref:uncharacterized protein n=1 Tax=Punctularia strigosozonata (strain HHB-11173) TaxID=741275 RepID=UPI0004417DB3|nr:uncharacterized protein PUNSTDRAFT_136202 [Punctularia strigosozonata HHB-11173 SS5]EIN07524.1 hypothetical protein PUNSTDRAFT_136202 [Punctularia strigosozonata HHB-11173 SS5]